MTSLAGEQREERFVEAPAVGLGHRANDALTRKTGALDHVLGRRVADVDVGSDAFDSEGDGMLGEETCDRGRKAAPPRMRQDEVTYFRSLSRWCSVTPPTTSPLLASTAASASSRPLFGEHRRREDRVHVVELSGSAG
jgi:hypothetical protein